MEDNGRGESLCKVCGDKASGKHYGVASCDGCRGFFKRSIRRYARNLDYVCKENNQCVVDVSRRNQCQACRFTKCLQVNMKREAVQHERAPRSSSTSLAAMAVASRKPAAATALYPHGQQQRIYHSASSSASSLAATAPYHPLLYPAFFSFKPAVPAVPAFPSATLDCTSDLLRLTTAAAHLAPRAPPAAEALSGSAAGKEDEVTSSEEAAAAGERSPFKGASQPSLCFSGELCRERHPAQRATEGADERLSSRLMTPLLCSSASDAQTANFSLLPAENVYEFAAKLLFLAVKWPRSISSFVQLSYRDQAILLEECWCELFVLTAAQWNFPVEESHLIPTSMAADKRQILSDEARRLRELLARCAILRIDHSEYACLKAIVLFKGESRGLCEPARVTALQEQTVSVLSDRGAGRIGHLLLLLPPARALCRRTLHELLFKPTVGDVAVERLLDDMINAIRPH